MEPAPLILRLLTAMALMSVSTSRLTVSLNTKDENFRTDVINRNTDSIAGNWSPWGTWSLCSRTCGGGIAVQTRECKHYDLNDRTRGGRKRRRLPIETEPHVSPKQHIDEIKTSTNITLREPRCLGQDKRYHECNTRACPGPEKDFRAEQCTSFDKRPFKGHYFVWLPYVDSKNPCQLNCRPSGRSFYATLAQAIDGTACSKPGFRAVCVKGHCKAIGLNGVISQWSSPGSGPGTGSYRCGSGLVSGLFTRNQLPLGYTLVATLPPGACRINITEIHHSNNYLALKSTNSSFIINGNFAISWPGEYEAAGTKFMYKRQSGNIVESISAPGPLLQPVDVMVLYQHPNNGIKYEYTMPVDDGEVQKQNIANPAPAPPLLIAPRSNVSYHQPRSLSHHVHRPRMEIEDNVINQNDNPKNDEVKKGENEKYPFGAGVLATESEKPTQNHLPQRHRRRKFIWKVSGYSGCSKTCAGFQTKILACVRELNQVQVSEKRCGSKPPNISAMRPCGGPCPPRWTVGAWSSCSASCGTATQTRQVECKQDISHQSLNVKVVDALCPDNRPASVQKCLLPECPTNERSEIHLKSNDVNLPNKERESFEQVPKTNLRNRSYRINGETEKFTDIVAVKNDTLGKAVSKDNDDVSNEIIVGADGVRYRNNGHWKISNAWMYSEWTQDCSEECGKGLQTRMVKCADPSGCDERKRPIDSRACSSDRKCNTQSSKWFSGPWSPCSNPCAINSKMTREVVCVSYYKGQHRVNAAACPPNTKPDSERPCPPSMLRGDCPPEWFISDWSQCVGPCGSTQQARLVTCQSSSGGPEGSCATARPANRRDCVPSQCHLGAPVTKELRSNDNENSLIKPPVNDGDCVDKIPTCLVAVQARLCQYEFYATSCCAACKRAPNIS